MKAVNAKVNKFVGISMTLQELLDDLYGRTFNIDNSDLEYVLGAEDEVTVTVSGNKVAPSAIRIKMVDPYLAESE